jgi:protein ImuA
MGAATRQQEVLEELRRRIRRIERRPGRREGFLSSGSPAIDALLPGGGFPRGALSALSGGPASGKTAVALAALREAQEDGSLAAFVDGPGELYPPAALAIGIDLGRLLIVRPEPEAARAGGDGRPGAPPPGLWAAEVLLGSGAFAAVAVDVPLRGVPAARADAMLRRLRAAAEKGGAAALLLGQPGGVAIPAAVRLDLDEVRRGVARRAAGGGKGGRVA